MKIKKLEGLINGYELDNVREKIKFLLHVLEGASEMLLITKT